MTDIGEILEGITRINEDINRIKSKKTYGKERRRVPSCWRNLNLTPLQLFIEYAVTNGLGYHDSFYWRTSSTPPSEYEKVKISLRLGELKDKWSEINPRQTPIVSEIQ